MGLLAAILLFAIAYLIVGITILIEDFLPWMYDDAERTELPPSCYQSVAWGVVLLWPRDAYHDLSYKYKQWHERRRV